jgi:recombinational DNA repair protein (RecF pathway)
MSHALYQTPAWVLKTKNRGEANKLIWLYTRDFGLIYTTAQSIRLGGAKMKSHIHNLSFVDVDVVRGRDIWRLVGTHELHSGMQLVTSPWYPFFEKIARLLVRLCVDQEPHGDLWDLLVKIRADLPFREESEIDIFEIHVVTQILSLLGYFDLPEALQTKTPALLGDSARLYIKKHKAKIIIQINEAFVASQL